MRALHTRLRGGPIRTFKSHLELRDDRGLMGSVSEEDSAALWLNLYLALRFQHHVPRGTGGERPREALIRRGASRVEGQCSGEIGQLHGKRKPSVTTFLPFHSSAFPLRLSTPPVILNMVLLSHAALMHVCVRPPVYLCSHLCSYLCMNECTPACHFVIPVFSSPKHHFSHYWALQQRAQSRLFSMNKK